MISVVLFLLSGIFLPSPQGAAQPDRIFLVAHDLEHRPLTGVRFAFDQVKSPPTNRSGATELYLRAGRLPGGAISIALVAGPPDGADWFIINALINIPATSEVAEVVLMRRTTLRQLAAAVRDVPRDQDARQRGPTAEDRKNALVAIAARYGLKPDQLEPALRSFAQTGDLRDRGIAAYLKSQYDEAVRLLEEAKDAMSHDLAETYKFLGAALYDKAEYRKAEKAFRTALALQPDDADLLGWLGEALSNLASTMTEWQEAEMLLRRALELDQNGRCPDDPIVAVHLDNLASLLQLTNRASEAEALLRSALAIDEWSRAADDPVTAQHAADLGGLLQELNRFEEAETLYRRALSIDQARYGTGDYHVASDLNAMATLLFQTDRVSEAEDALRQAIAIDERMLKPTHISVARDLGNLALLLGQTSREAEAEALYRRALAIDKLNLGDRHPGVAIDLNNLAMLLNDEARYGEAEQLLRLALDIDEHSFGAKHPTVAIDLGNLALLLKRTKRFGEAEPLMLRALAIAEASWGQFHPLVATTLNNLALLLRDTGRRAEAERLMREALRVDETIFGAHHLKVGIRAYNLALTVLDRGGADALADGEALMRRALVIYIGFEYASGYPHEYWPKVAGRYRRLLASMGASDGEIDRAIKTLVQSVRANLPTCGCPSTAQLWRGYPMCAANEPGGNINHPAGTVSLAAEFACRLQNFDSSASSCEGNYHPCYPVLKPIGARCQDPACRPPF